MHAWPAGWLQLRMEREGEVAGLTRAAEMRRTQDQRQIQELTASDPRALQLAALQAVDTPLCHAHVYVHALPNL